MPNPPHPPDETPDQLAAALKRNHPELSDAQIARLLGGPPPRRDRMGRRRLVDNGGKREAPYEAVSGGRTTSARSRQAEQDEERDR